MEINIEKIRGGDIEEFELLYRQFCQPLIMFANKYIYDQDVAENVVQDVFVNVWMNRENLDVSGNIKAYLYTSVRNKALNTIKHSHIKREYQENLKLDDIDPNTPESKVMYKEVEFAVNNAVRNLPEKCRMIFLMSRNDQLSYAEIANILGLSVKTIENQMGKALKILRKHLASVLFHVIS